MKKQFSPIMIVHLVLLILMILFNAFTAIMILSGSGVESPSSAEQLSIYLYGIISILNIIAPLKLTRCRRIHTTQNAPLPSHG